MSGTQIDFDHLNRYVDGDTALTREIFSLFQHQVEMWGRGLDAGADDEVWESVVHSLKGSARAIGANGLAGMCEAAERLVGEGRRMGARDVAVQNIEFAIDQVRTEIQRWEHARSLKDLQG
ncbi:Hpt domain-containing protein [uncultured Algimonas sp.]|uniref:Hpt domain-containing protein n=1 Tax=uncultured Algimonas sp. TaxID=1547920 RepID=UPI00260546B6|nr:Hpt domain-containing protein [uncultured Algimonas sp.]